DWPTTLFLIISHVIGFVGTGIYVYFNGIHPLEVFSFSLFYVLTGLSITAGYHRYFAHRSYECHALLRLFYLIFGACAYENTALRWASDHRMHHKHVDTDLDPYNIKKGGWYAHIGWVFLDGSQFRNLDNVSDLKNDPLVLWQSKYYILIATLIGTVAPFLIGLCIGRPWGGLLWGGFFRVAFVHHTTFFINSLAHMFGRQTYTDMDSSRDNGWLAFLTYGEGYHNYHHKFQADYRNGIRWYQWDPTKWTIALCAWLRLARRLNRTPPQKILSARLEMEMLYVRKRARSVLQAQ
ncbi:MAG: fatty acid desaturase, partial [Elusimicrobia bacterium]|nr:fatty acid desaturase [Elusimicrobiota bacterium]